MFISSYHYTESSSLHKVSNERLKVNGIGDVSEGQRFFGRVERLCPEFLGCVGRTHWSANAT